MRILKYPFFSGSTLTILHCFPGPRSHKRKCDLLQEIWIWSTALQKLQWTKSSGPPNSVFAWLTFIISARGPSQSGVIRKHRYLTHSSQQFPYKTKHRGKPGLNCFYFIFRRILLYSFHLFQDFLQNPSWNLQVFSVNILLIFVF